MSFWIFKCNPTKYDLERRLAHPENRTTWWARQHRADLQIGDTAFIYRTGKEPGIVASLRVTSAPAEFPEIPFEKDFSKDIDDGPEWRVHCEFTRRHPVISKEELLKLPAIRARARVLDQQGTNFPLSPEEAQSIERLIASRG